MENSVLDLYSPDRTHLNYGGWDDVRIPAHKVPITCSLMSDDIIIVHSNVTI